MAQVKISELPSASALTGSEVLPIVQGGSTLGATVNQIKDKIQASTINVLKMNASSVQTLANIGELAFNPDTQTLEVKCSADVTLSIGQESYIRGKNAEASTILNGTVVYVSGGLGANSLIKRAGNADSTAERVIGVATQDIGANNIGFITTSGVVNKLNTSSYAEGDLLWLGTNGTMTNVKPNTSVDQICIGVVLRSHATEGSILVAVKDDWRDKLAEVRSDLSKTDNSLFSIGSKRLSLIDFRTETEFGIYANGAFKSTPNFVTRESSVSEGELIEFNVHCIYSGSSYQHCATFFNDLGEIVDAVLSNVTSLDNPTFRRMRIPENAVKVAVSTSVQYIDSSYYKILKEDKYLVVDLDNDQNINGLKTFKKSPIVPFPDDNYSAVPKSFVDNIIGKTQSIINNFDTTGLYNSNIWRNSSNWKSARIDISEGVIIQYRLYSGGSTAHLLTFLDVNNSIISSIMSDRGDASIVLFVGSATAPSGAHAVIATTFLANVEDSKCTMLIDNNEIFEKKAPSKTIIVDKTKEKDAANNIYKTIGEALSVSTGNDIIKLYGNKSDPYNEFHLTLPDGITIIGIGTPWIKGEQLASETTDNIFNLSTLEAYNSCTLENLLITCKNARYPIHADFSNGNTIKNIRNCQFIHYGNKEAYDYQVANSGNPSAIMRTMSAWGGGTKSGDRVYIDGCSFESPLRAFSTHNNTDFNLTNGASIVKVTNSKMISHGIDRDGSNLNFLVPIHIQSLTSNANDSVIFENCEANGYMCFQNGLTHNVYCDIKGLKQIYNYAGGSLSIGHMFDSLDVTAYPFIRGEISSYKNMSLNTIQRGKAVKRSGIGFDLFTNSDNVNDFLGVLMQDSPSGTCSDIKKSGYIPIKYLTGQNTIGEGLNISVDATGSFIVGDQFIICKTVDNSNVFIK